VLIQDFISKVLEAWFEYYSKPPQTGIEVARECIWNNKFVVADRKPLMYKRWFEKGIISIGDMLDSNGRVLSLQHLIEKYKLKTHFLEYLTVKEAVPKSWLKLVQTNKKQECVSESNVLLESIKEKVIKLKNKQVYCSMIESLVKQPTSIDTWISEFPFLHDNDFNDIFVLGYTNGSVYLQSLQYKILHRIFPCNYMLHKWKIAESNKCKCGEIDTLEHYFYYCESCKSFWKKITEWFNSVFSIHIPLKIIDVIMGIVHRKSQDNILALMNFIIIHGKCYIFKCNKNSTRLSFTAFCKIIKSAIMVEIELNCRKGKAPRKELCDLLKSL